MTTSPGHQAGTVTLPRPHITNGPCGVPADTADIDYLTKAADEIETFYRPFGSTLRAVVVQLLRDAAGAIGSPAVEEPSPSAVEAAARALYGNGWDEADQEARTYHRYAARDALTAALPRLAPRVAPTLEQVARALMPFLGCDQIDDVPECPSCDGSVPCHHEKVTYCQQHDENAETLGGPCPKAVQAATALKALAVAQPTVVGVRAQTLREAADEADRLARILNTPIGDISIDEWDDTERYPGNEAAGWLRERADRITATRPAETVRV